MNEKLTIQELINLLAQRHDMDQTDAETFVKTFFALIEEALENDKYVKIKGLGTFKLVEVDTRESIDVNTGERIEIMGHNRITFTPDTTMRDLVNKPFSHFETVVLNENTRFDDMDESGREIGEPDADDEDEAVETIENPDMNPNQGEMENDNIPTEEKTDVHPEIDPVEEEQQPSEETGGSKESSASKRIFRLPWCMIATAYRNNRRWRNRMGNSFRKKIYSRIYCPVIDTGRAEATTGICPERYDYDKSHSCCKDSSKKRYGYICTYSLTTASEG